jgi:hypothetical protein
MMASLGCFFAHLSYSLRIARLALLSSCLPCKPFPMRYTELWAEQTGAWSLIDILVVGNFGERFVR